MFFLLFLTEKLTGEKLDVPEVTQSEEGQKQKLGIVLEATNRVSLSTPSFLSLLATNQHITEPTNGIAGPSGCAV